MLCRNIAACAVLLEIVRVPAGTTTEWEVGGDRSIEVRISPYLSLRWPYAAAVSLTDSRLSHLYSRPHAQVPESPGPVAVTVDGATTRVVVDEAAAEDQEEQVELVAERMEAMRNKHDDDVRCSRTLTRVLACARMQS